MTELYVYYKLESRHTARLREIAARFPEVRLLRKDGDAQPPTWMEIHIGPQAEASERALAQALAGLISGPRHVERFQPA
ncbi:MAG: DUF4936 family protein [Paucibacter sp.]|nr:DUF4936 family protein [Roseateles sp.]